MKVCDIYIERQFLKHQTLTYSADGFDVQPGIRVRITLNGRPIVGFVDKVYTANSEDFSFKLEPIVALIDEKALLTPELLACARWMEYQTVSPYIACLQTMLPRYLKPKSTARRGKTMQVLQRTEVEIIDSLTDKQNALMDAFGSVPFLSLKDARYIYSGYKRLIENGYLEQIEIEVSYLEKPVEKIEPKYSLTEQQEITIKNVEIGKSQTYLLHGVTGSGKTEIYLQLAQRVVDEGEQVLILVPEIALTPQMISRVSSRFGSDIAVYHSALNEQEKYEQYQRVLNQEVHIVVGTRSASFLPFSKLGLIVVDEEHDESYKQTNTPYYHARDVAKWRSEYHQCPLILGSASPSLESYARALKGVYTLLELPSRINDMLPDVEVIDTRKALQNQENAMLTGRMKTLIQETLDRNEQVMLLLNRRGYLTWVKDTASDAILMCPNCDVALNFHYHDKMLKCHVCGYQTQEYPKNADQSPVHLIGGGVGTQRLEHWLHQVFPNARVLRMDHDTTQKKHAHANILNAFNIHEADILIGTQMIAKGLDNANVTLVGITNIDAALMRTDFRSVEQTFDLVLQAAGRSGRGEKPGKVAIQTFNADHYAIAYGARHDYKRFFKQEMTYRKEAGYPPYRYLIALYFKDSNESSTLRAAGVFTQCLQHFDGKVIGPISLGKLNTIHQARVVLKGTNLDAMIRSVHHAMQAYDAIEKVGVSVDVNPLTIT